MKKMMLMLAMVALTVGVTNAAEAKGKKMSHAQAKQVCLDKNPSLVGKALRKCIKDERK